MKAIQYTSFGDSAVLQFNQVNKPVPKEDEVLIKMEATTVNPLDIKIRKGIMQKQMPIQFPYVPGSDVAGVVKAIGSSVTRLKPGDLVFGTCSGGSYAEYVITKQKLTALRPKNITAPEAAALAVPLNTARTVIESAQLQSGQKILIIGAAGAVGSVMTQMAKQLDAYVIGVASGEGCALLKKLGADEVIDYKKQDVSTLVKDVDVVADLAGGETQNKLFAVLKKGGKLLSIVMPPLQELAAKYGVTAVFAFSDPSYEKLDQGRKLVEEGKITIHITRRMKLEQAAQAQDILSAGGVNGKIVLEP